MYVTIFPIKKAVPKDELYISVLYPGEEDQLY